MKIKDDIKSLKISADYYYWPDWLYICQTST